LTPLATDSTSLNSSPNQRTSFPQSDFYPPQSHMLRKRRPQSVLDAFDQSILQRIRVNAVDSLYQIRIILDFVLEDTSSPDSLRASQSGSAGQLAARFTACRPVLRNRPETIYHFRWQATPSRQPGRDSVRRDGDRFRIDELESRLQADCMQRLARPASKPPEGGTPTQATRTAEPLCETFFRAIPE